VTLAVAFGEEAPISPFCSVRDAIAHAVNQFEDGRFVYVKRNGDIAERSYKETFDIARRLQLALSGQGMTPGDGLIINLNDSEAFVPALWAAMIGGFVAIPFLRTSERRFGDLSTVAAFARSRLGGVFALTDEKNVTTERAPWLLRFDALLLEGRKESPEGIGARYESRPKDLRLAVLTSGTTGRPRMVCLSDGAVLARWWPKLPDAANARAFLSWSPFDHIMGLSSAAPNVSCKVHLDAERFAADPLTWLDLLETKGVTHATMTNFGMSLVVEALRSCPERSWHLDHVSRIGVGAEAISPDICCQFLERLRSFGIARDSIILGYGLTECGPVAGGGTAFSEASCSDGDRAISLDRPAPGHSIRIVGMGDQILEESEVGRIEVRGPTMTSGYLGDEEETKGLLREDNWLRTGDLGFLKASKLTVVGREKEVIVVNAKKY
jgi:nonribosomal peptide synthetase DhbF